MRHPAFRPTPRLSRLFARPRSGAGRGGARANARRALLATALLAGGLAFAGCHAAEPVQEPLVEVQAATVRQQPLVETVQTEALLYPLHQAVLTPKISAPVARFFVNRGDHVRRGELVAQLENRDLAATALENQGSYEQAQADYQSATQAAVPQQVRKAQLDLASAQQALAAAQRTYVSRQNLYRQGALPRRDLDQAQVAFVDARAADRIAQQQYDALKAGGAKRQLQAAHGQLTAAQGRYEAAQAQLQYSAIRSPLQGVVTDRPVYPGELATTSAPLMTIMDLSEVVARAHVPQAQMTQVKPGDLATLTAQGITLPGRVTVVSPALDPNSTTEQIWVQAANPGERLRPGATAQLAIQVGTLPDALVIPSTALLTAADGSATAMVIGADHKAHARPVQAGARAQGLVQIISGLKAGEEVVTTGAYGLDDGTTVRVVSGAEATAATAQHEP